MSPLAEVAFWAAAFVASHLLMSHPLRAPLVARVGERAFAILYSIVSLVTFGLMAWAARRVGPEQPLWEAGEPLVILGSVLMWVGSVLFVGSLKRNPAFPTGGAPVTEIGEAKGVFAITRHPMMWSFALWAIVHIVVAPQPHGMIIAVAVLILALVGARGQDRKKELLVGEPWADWESRTSYIPFARGFASPGAFALVGGTILFLLATWAHGALGAPPAGPWRWA